MAPDGFGVLLLRLQWGRNMFVAECFILCLNVFLDIILQWGRNMFVAECQDAGGGDAAQYRPSMGPQHVRCGMPA